jgi:hypothetical protein
MKADNSINSIIIGTVLVILSPVIAVVIRMSFLLLAGYDVDKDPKDLAQEIFEEGGSVTRCMHLQWSLPGMGPTLEQQRHRCVLEYADIAKDPSACELLMPSSYGWSCLGVSQISADSCSIDFKKTVSWPIDALNNKWETESFSKCLHSDTGNTTRDSCCYLLRLTSDPAISDCSRFNNDENFMNLCLSQLALKEGNEILCKEITDRNKRAICVMQARYVHTE